MRLCLLQHWYVAHLRLLEQYSFTLRATSSLSNAPLPVTNTVQPDCVVDIRPLRSSPGQSRFVGRSREWCVHDFMPTSGIFPRIEVD